MRPRVGIALARPLRTRALSASTSARQPRRIPPDFPRRTPVYAQTAVDDSPALAPKTEPDTEQDKEKPRRRAVKSPGSPSKTPPPATPTKVPVGPEAIWTSKSLGEGGESRALPPDDMLQDALAQLLVTLQPQTQYRAAYANGGAPLIEPTLALYCPIEGGDYVIDDTVKELAARINGDVIVIDAVQLAAGEHGSFGKAASILNFPQNPLHFPSSGSPSSRSRPVNEDPDTDDDDAEDEDRDPEVHRVTFGNVSAVAVPVRTVRVRNGISNPFAPASSSSNKNTPVTQSELKFFFESIINAHVPSASSSGSQHRPRIIYLRDFSLLAPSAHIWYPHLLAAIRTRRQGALLRPSIPVPYPTTLVLGVSPSLVPVFPSPSPPSPPSGLMNMLLGQRSHRPVPSPRTEVGHGSEERADRLRDRLRKWSRSGTIINDLPSFTSPSQRSSNPGPTGFMSANGFTSLFGAHPSTAGDRSNDALGDKGGVSVGTGNKSGYFRVCGVVPAVRDEARERSVRRARRAEVNALVARMAVGAVGGKVIETPATPTIPAKPGKQKKETEDKDKKESTASSQSTEVAPGDKMVEDWSRKLLDWHAARRLADRALACAVLSGNSITEPVTVLEDVTPAPETSEEAASSNSMPPPTAVSWDAIRTAWDAVRLSLGYGGKLADGVTEASTAATPEPTTTPAPLVPPAPPTQAPASSSTTPAVPKWSGIGSPREPVPWIDAALAPPTILHTGKPPEPGAEDEVVEEIKNDPDLDTHEERLLGCIVNPAELQTTFSQVHLPDTTIDSVRTLVSLPLLYPAAFRSGILAQHAMTGALLFGPPGTGKTLLARALAKESGARMMVVKPSDVMDMYVGEGEKLVRSVFSLARRLSPCIVFLDEIDALLGARSSRDTGGAASAHRGLVTEFMQEMDGLRSSASSNIVVVGATNRPFDLDDAVLRRLPRRLLIDLPGLDEREAILNIMLRGEDVSSDVDVKALAKQTEGFSGSDLKNLVVSAALDAVKEKVELPWRTGSVVEKKKEEESGEKTVDVPTAEAANVAPDATSTETPVPGTQAASEAAPDTLASAEAPATKEPPAASNPTDSKPSTEASATPSRTLTNRHFTRALKEITPSASEALGTLADLRKWNAEFGGGERKKSVKAWGGRFGFGGSGKKPSEEGAGRVVREDAE